MRLSTWPIPVLLCSNVQSLLAKTPEKASWVPWRSPSHKYLTSSILSSVPPTCSPFTSALAAEWLFISSGCLLRGVSSLYLGRQGLSLVYLGLTCLCFELFGPGSCLCCFNNLLFLVFLYLLLSFRRKFGQRNLIGGCLVLDCCLKGLCCGFLIFLCL